MLNARKAVREMHEYHPPLAGRTGLRLDFNENTEGCSPRVLARVREITAEDLARYPERAPVEAIVAPYLGLPADQVLLTNGVDEAIHLLCEAYLEPADEVLVVTPTFSMYEIFAEATGAHVVRVQCGEDMRFPFEKVAGAVTAATKLIAVASPNNPTGGAASRDELLAIAQQAPHAALLVDEAYFEFHGQTVLSEVGRQSNLFVARTFSKAYGLAGLRIGALIGEEQLIGRLRGRQAYLTTSGLAAEALIGALEGDPDFPSRHAGEVRALRAELIARLRALELFERVYDSETNFVFVRCATPAEAASIRATLARNLNVIVASTAPLGEPAGLRIGVSLQGDTDRLLAGLTAIRDKEIPT